MPVATARSRAVSAEYAGRSPRWFTLAGCLLLLRVTVAILFMAHALVRLLGGSVEQFAAFLGSRGIPYGVLVVWLVSLYELAGGLALALGWWARWAAAGLLLIAAVGIVLIHAGNGWFVGEHGIGGMEYSVCLIAALLVLMAADRQHLPGAG